VVHGRSVATVSSVLSSFSCDIEAQQKENPRTAFACSNADGVCAAIDDSTVRTMHTDSFAVHSNGVDTMGRMWHQKLDSPTNSTGNHNPCSYFPYVGGYAVASTPGIDGLSGLWERNFFEPGCACSGNAT